MIASDLRKNVEVRYDQTYSGYFNTAEFNMIANNAMQIVVKNAYNEKKDSKDDLLYNLRRLVPSTAPNDPSYITLPSDFKFEESVQLQYVSTLTLQNSFREATLNKIGKEFGYLDQPRARKPQYNLLNVSTDKRLYFFPTGAINYTLIYIREPLPINTATGDTIDLTNTLVEKLIDQCILLFDQAIYNKENYQINKDLLNSY